MMQRFIRLCLVLVLAGHGIYAQAEEAAADELRGYVLTPPVVAAGPIVGIAMSDDGSSCVVISGPKDPYRSIESEWQRISLPDCKVVGTGTLPFNVIAAMRCGASVLLATPNDLRIAPLDTLVPKRTVPVANIARIYPGFTGTTAFVTLSETRSYNPIWLAKLDERGAESWRVSASDIHDRFEKGVRGKAKDRPATFSWDGLMACGDGRTLLCGQSRLRVEGKTVSWIEIYPDVLAVYRTPDPGLMIVTSISQGSYLASIDALGQKHTPLLGALFAGGCVDAVQPILYSFDRSSGSRVILHDSLGIARRPCRCDEVGNDVDLLPLPGGGLLISGERAVAVLRITSWK